MKYCSRECQKAHWTSHKPYCKHKYNDFNWQVSFESFVDTTPKKSSVQTGEWLWGNQPAMDILNWSNCEGSSQTDYPQLSICFPASGDLRNTIKTINSLPKDFDGVVNVYVNDNSSKIPFRNFLFLYLLITEGESSIDMVIQLWYSIAITHDQNKKLTELINAITKDKVRTGN